MDTRSRFSRRQFLKTMAATGAVSAAQLGWAEAPLISPRKAHAASTVRFQFSVPEPLAFFLVESLVDRFHKSQSDVEVKVSLSPRPGAAETDHRRLCWEPT